MATQKLPIINWSTIPDDVLIYTEPVNLNYHGAGLHNLLLLTFGITTGSDIGLAGHFKVPEDYVGAPVIEVEWSTVAALAITLFFGGRFDYDVAEEAETWAFTTTPLESVENTSAARNSPQLGHRLSITLTAANFTIGDNVFYTFFREDTADTLAAIVYVADILFTYSDV